MNWLQEQYSNESWFCPCVLILGLVTMVYGMWLAQRPNNEN